MRKINGPPVPWRISMGEITKPTIELHIQIVNHLTSNKANSIDTIVEEDTHLGCKN